MEQKEFAKWELLMKLNELNEYKKDIKYNNDPKSRKNKLKARLLGKLLQKEIDTRYKPLKWGNPQPQK